MDWLEISKNQTPKAARLTLINIGMAAMTFAFNQLFILNPYQNRKVSLDSSLFVISAVIIYGILPSLRNGFGFLYPPVETNTVIAVLRYFRLE